MKKNTSTELINEINTALKGLMWGSVEIYVQNNTVTQITVKNIKKTSVSTKDESGELENRKNGNKVLTNKKQKYINIYSKLD
ncbi:MAG: hypothetical protein A3F61_00500 [Candidatus Blackburnbacteria bacterium RIFCSPHIGHO2_12_FULL_41_13b]|uniref:DUF2292 domain-containing protein n=1 Tax=Candidatus Blackburnbacteria bacterium RIFCSPHIGHO2_12_FULL_41_13b TaxID=1797517 RepID=A0A1G1V622_9BACT|nr:MAG: hypothetical protein A3F61_00500 [Candidatus Blackburnbacteria bacterium RIFCSPHIGHO2_12_FULL_41_13b]